MIYDLHIHHDLFDLPPQKLLDGMDKAGIAGGVVLSPSAVPFFEGDRIVRAPKERIDNVMAFTKDSDRLYPFFFIDPTDKDAIDQVHYALDQGIAGFKTICTHFYPDDERAVPVYHEIAQSGKPYLFHSGILYDGKNASGNYNRPCNFEVLLSVPKLRFALAHISWPWCDECIAVFGKFQNYLEISGEQGAAEMFIDTTPGTPALYREDALRKLIAMGAEDHMIWGTDCKTDYSAEYAQSIRARDEEVMSRIEGGDRILKKWYSENFMRFLTGK